jgi:hypothetical protein
MRSLERRHRQLERPAHEAPATFAEKLAARLRAKSRANYAGPAAEALLLDLSGSMWAHAGSGRTKLEELVAVVRSLPPVRTFGFSWACFELRPEEIESHPQGGGGTRMDRAFEAVKAAGTKSVALITDGLPTCSQEDALRAAGGLCLHIFYVGPEPVPQFLKDLARATGGTFSHDYLGQPQLETKIRGLLAPPPSNPIKL